MVRVWKIAPGNRAMFWDDCRSRKCISINWLNKTDLSIFPMMKDIRRALRKLKPANESRGANSIWRFANEIHQGHVVIANEGLSFVRGIGVVRSGYIPPDDIRNPNRNQEHHRHIRFVDWLIDRRLNLGMRLFIQPAVQELSSEQFDIVINTYLTQYPEAKKILNYLFELKKSETNPIGPAADEGDDIPDTTYNATGGDRREQVLQLIKKRRGRSKFRNALLQRYQKRCLVTGCEIEAILEAAHIDPYRNDEHNHPGNGLLLRTDIHTLFDLDLLGIEPKSLHITLHPDIENEYKPIIGKSLNCTSDLRPSFKALTRRYKHFQSKKLWPA